jgi:O-antigen ligase
MPDTVTPTGGAFVLAPSHRERLLLIADGLAAALAASLPWSTSATGILAGLWLVAVLPTIDGAALRRVVTMPAGGLPVLLWALGAIGMAWADVPLVDRLDGFNSYHKLLFIPLLLFHFQRSEHGAWVLKCFLWSCGLLMTFSWVVLMYPDFPGVKHVSPGVPVKDYISQSALFSVCIAVAIDLALDAWRNARIDRMILWVALALAFLANIFFVATSRTALVVIPVLLVLFGFKRFGLKGVTWLLIVLLVLAAAAWLSSKSLRERVMSIPQEVSIYRSGGGPTTSAGERLEFWKKSIGFIEAAPIFGHGTGSIREQFRRVASSQSDTSALVAANPHNQTLAVAIQLGLVGTIALFAMWVAHLMLFRGESLTAWVGLVVVVQNLVGSLFNSHLFDFTHGWGYVIGVGVAGGLVMREAALRGQKALS